jgi:cell wall-associated NlpC family hydrolase
VATRRHLHIRRGLIAALVAAVGSVLLLPQAGQAAPRPTLDQVKAEITALQSQAEVAQEKLNAAQVALAAGQRTLAQINARVARSQAAVDAAQRQLGRLASAAYQSGGIDQTLQLLMADNPTQFLEQASTLDGVSRHQVDVMRTVATAKQRLAEDKLAAAQELATLQKLRDTAAASYADVKARQRAAQALYDQLNAAQRAALARAAAAARSQAAAASATRASYVTRSSRSSTTHHHHYSGGGGGSYSGSIGARVVAFAMAQVGDSYVFGGTGPSSWDCSGLTMEAYASVGISLPHSSYSQWDSGRHISSSQLEPGDLVFYYQPMHHVGIYIGGGRIVHAANPYEGVTTASLYSMPYDGAVRPY